MTKVEAAGCMPEPFPADNKEEIHGTTVIRVDIWGQRLTALNA
jgi:hypothetical protein